LLNNSRKMKNFYALFIFLSQFISMSSQNENVHFSSFDGVIAIGYVNQGGFLNFTGPNIHATHKNSKFTLGMLPSLRFKRDIGTPKNALITPNLGIGFTYCIKTFAIQIPLYYNSKTHTEGGKWHLGLGVGLRLDKFKQKNKNDAKI